MTVRQVYAIPGGTAQAPRLAVDVDDATQASYLAASLAAIPITAGEQTAQVTGYWAAGVLTGAGPWVGAIIAAAMVGQAPALRGALD